MVNKCQGNHSFLYGNRFTIEKLNLEPACTCNSIYGNCGYHHRYHHRYHHLGQHQFHLHFSFFTGLVMAT